MLSAGLQAASPPLPASCAPYTLIAPLFPFWRRALAAAAQRPTAALATAAQTYTQSSKGNKKRPLA